MPGKTPNKEEETAEKKAVPEASQPDVDPILMRQQQLQQQYQQINGRIMELRQQEDLVKNMITDATIQAAEIRGALKEIQKG
jgi:TolA-binding protein